MNWSPPQLMREMDKTLTVIRNTEAGKDTAFQFEFYFHEDVYRRSYSDHKICSALSELTNITAVNFSWRGGHKLHAVPDFSKNPALVSVDFSNCKRLRTPTKFSENPEDIQNLQKVSIHRGNLSDMDILLLTELLGDKLIVQA